MRAHIVSLGLLVALSLAGLSRVAPAAGPAAPAASPAAPAREVALPLDERQIRTAGVETAPIEQETGLGELVAPGVVAVPPQQLRVVAAPAAGLVETLFVAVDEEVKEGAPIARLKSSDLIEAQRAFLHADSDAALAAEKLRRDEQLYKERIIAERRVIVTRAEATQARAALAERTQLLVLDGMTQDEIETLRRDRKLASALTVRAPISGTVLARHGTAGERVQDSAPLVTIGHLDPIWVNLQIPIGRAPSLESADRVRLPSFGLEGHLIRIGRTVDSATQSVTAVAEFRTHKSVLRPGQALQAILRLANSDAPQWRVPADAVVAHRDHSYVFVRTLTGFRAIPVTLVSETPHSASVHGALKAGERVATRGLLILLAELAEFDR
jgi:RND family efflux transporter MFP subunit